MNPVIAAHGLTKRFGGKTVVDRLDLEVPAGAVFALLGDNGAGKSTTIRMLTGLLPPDAGKSEILGQDCWAAAPALRKRVGYVPEKPRFYDWMSAREIGWFTSGFHGAGYMPRFLDLIERFRLDPSARLKNLSKGGYAKVGLALALAFEPEVLVLDEPTSSMVDLAGAGRTILISSHGVAEVERVASHAAFIAEGRLLLSASLDDLRQRFVRVRLNYDAAPPDGAALGKVLEKEVSGRQWQAVLLDPDRAALDALRQRADVGEFEETPLTLEEMYTALLARYHTIAPPTPSANGRPTSGEPSPIQEGAKP
jgi:ABC-2 type transport system ATP-binding protein